MWSTRRQSRRYAKYTKKRCPREFHGWEETSTNAIKMASPSLLKNKFIWIPHSLSGNILSTKLSIKQLHTNNLMLSTNITSTIRVPK